MGNVENYLVSIIIVTYNSAEFVIETLESSYRQTWPNLELIITDDFSTDNTVDICQNWILKNGIRFVRTQILTVTKNTGTAANCNRGLNVAKGEWIKYCAGDDALLPNCIEDNLKHVSENPNIKALFSYCRMYLKHTTEDCFVGLNPGEFPSNIITDEITAEVQYKLLLVSNRIPFTPSFFIHRDTRNKYGEIDERFQFSEDYQLFLSLTKNGIKLYFMEKETMKYRIHNESLSKQIEEYIVHPMYYRNEPIMKKYSYPFLPWELKFSKMQNWYVNQIFKIDFINRRNKFNSSLHYVLSRLLNPFHYISYIKAHYGKKYRNKIFYK